LEEMSMHGQAGRFVVSVVGFSLLVVLALIPTDAGETPDPVQAFREALAANQSIPENEREALLQIVESAVADPDNRVPYGELSDNRKRGLSRALEDLAKKYPADEYDTPLQHEFHREMLRHRLDFYLMLPACRPYGDTARFDQQMESLAAELVKGASARYGSMVPGEALSGLEAAIRDRFRFYREDDTMPSFKGPFPEDFYDSFLAKAKELGDKPISEDEAARLEGSFKGYQKLPPDQRATRLLHAEAISGYLSDFYDAEVERSMLAGQYPDDFIEIHAEILRRAPTGELFRKAEEEKERIRKEIRERRNKEDGQAN